MRNQYLRIGFSTVLRNQPRRSLGAGLLLAVAMALALAAWAAGANVAAAGPWFVAPLGNDANDCQSMSASCLTINAAIAKAANGDTIIIASGVYTEGLTLAKDVTLIGFGSDATIMDGNYAQRVLSVAQGVTANVSDVSIVNGNSGNGAGGGVLNLGTLTLNRSVVYGNSSVIGGGGIASSGTLTLMHSLVVSNTASHYDVGGILLYGGSSVVDSSTISRNLGRTSSGGIGCASSSLVITGSIIAENSTYIFNAVSGANGTVPGPMTTQRVPSSRPDSPAPPSGGGLANFSCTIAITNSAIISNYAAGYGGAIENGSASITLVNVTMSNNSGDSSITNFGGAMTLTNVTVGNNPNFYGGYSIDNKYSGTSILLNTVVVNPCRTPVTSMGHNLFTDSSCGLNATGDLTDTNPLLGPLQDNGGPTPTHALLAGSPAINHGDNTGCPATDQRGIARPQAGVCDIGAYEYVFPYATFLPWVGR